MFRFPRFVFRRGQLIIDDGEIRAVPFGSTFMTVPEQNPDAVPVIRNWFERNSTLQFANFPVDDHDVGDAVVTNHPARL
jgi:formylmethanofuran dehydrogenase subunit A